MDDPELRRLMSPQEARVGELLLEDFEKSGIHMPKTQKDTFIALNDKIRELGHEFIAHALWLSNCCDHSRRQVALL